MKPAPFVYQRPPTLPEALAILAAHRGEARVLAGGQSLMPLLAMRLARPERLVDINRIDELKGISQDAGTLTIGAMTRYSEILASPEVAAHAPLLAEAIRHVAHHAIRNRGTIGGSLALADPAAETPAACLALNARVLARSASGEREIAIDDFLFGLLATALADDEIIVAVRIPKRPPSARHVFLEFARRRGDYAQAGIILAPAHAGVAEHRAVIFGVGGKSLRSPALEAALGTPHPAPLDRTALAAEVAAALDDGEALGYKTRIVITLAERALAQLARDR
jgi:carbon-monoxide dehydrogenase medium subunit